MHPTLDQDQIRISQRRLILAGLIGNVLEWYDFSIYGYFAAMIGRHFFPSSDPRTSLIVAFGVFSVGFISRPLGALLFGYLGDRYGRARALRLSILAMAIPTFTTGLLPSHQRIGLAAPVVMVILRLIQGLSAGGEYTTSIVFLAERSRHQNRRALAASAGLFGSIAGGMLGSAVGAGLSWAMQREELIAWGWRLPFISGIMLAFVGVLIRRELRGPSTLPAWSGAVIRQVLMRHRRTLVRVAGFELMEAVGFYTTFIYLATYLTSVVHVAEREAYAATTLSLAFVLMIIPAAAMLADRVGRKPVLLTAATCAALFGWPLFRLLHRPGFGFILLGQFGLAAIVGLYEGATPAAATEAFPASVRNTGVALAFNLSMTIFGGTAPLVATYLIARTHNDMAPAIYLIAVALISGAAVLTLRETSMEPLDTLPQPHDS